MSASETPEDTRARRISKDETQIHRSLPEIPGYEMIERIGRGGMAVVYKARHLKLKRIVAVKLLVDSNLEDQEYSERLEREGHAIAKLQHPNIAQVHEIGSIDSGPYLALEFLDGGNLASRIEGPFPPREAAQLVATLAGAIDYSHRQGIIHRDLKPANILFDSEDHPKVADFGLAKFINDPVNVTKTGAMMGTPTYMAPEQASGVVKQIGASCDVYGLGNILYELLTGRPPFLTDDYSQTLLMVLSAEPVPPRKLQPRVPRDLETICLRCLQKRINRRFDSAQELADDLDRFLDGRPIRARRTSPIEKATLWSQRRPVAATFVMLSAILMVALLVGGVLYNLQLQAANEQITLQRDRSERLFGSGRDLANWVLYNHADGLKSIRGTTQSQQELAVRLKQYLDELALQAEGDVDLSEELAEAYERLAQIQGDPYHQNVGKVKSALSSYQSALQLRKAIRDQRPDDPLARLNYANGLSNVAAVYWTIHESKIALDHYQRALSELEPLLEADPANDLIRQATGSVWLRLGDLYEQQNKLKDAESAFQTSLKILEEQVGDPPSSSKIEPATVTRSRLIQFYVAQAKAGDRSAIAKAKDHIEKFQKSIGDFENLDFENPQQGRELAQGLRIYADYLNQTAGTEAAMKVDRQVLKLFREYSAADPANATLIRDLCVSLSRVGRYCHEDGAYKQAAKYFQESVELTNRLAKRDPANIEFQKDLWVDSYDLGTTLLFDKQFTECEPHFQNCLSYANSIAQKSKSPQPSSTDQADEANETNDQNPKSKIDNARDLIRIAQSYERLGTMYAEKAKRLADPVGQKTLVRRALEYLKKSEKTFMQADKIEQLEQHLRDGLKLIRNTIHSLENFLSE